MSNSFKKFLEETGFTDTNLGKDINIAIIDTGCNIDFPTIKTKFNGVDYTDNVDDSVGHGTAIANIINDIVPKANLHILKCMDNRGLASMKTVYECLATANSIKDLDIVCMSFNGINELSITTMRLIHSLMDKGVLILASIGNDNRNWQTFPASIKGVYKVGGLSKDDYQQKSKSSNYSLDTHFVALGEDIKPSKIDESYSGTSFSNAIVIGQIAYLLSKNNKKAKDIDYRFFKPYFINDTYQTNLANGYLKGDKQ